MVAPQGSLKTYPELMVSHWDPAGPETAGEKDGPEEEEDFDNLTQDAEDEMSSASEESVLSVPELQVRVGQYSSMFCGFSNRFNLLIVYLLAFCTRDSPKIIFVFCERRGKELNVPYYI